jgi:hypothetical protein
MGMKYLGIDLTEKVNVMHIENNKTILKESEEKQVDGKLSFTVEGLILLGCSYYLSDLQRHLQMSLQRHFS